MASHTGGSVTAFAEVWIQSTPIFCMEPEVGYGGEGKRKNKQTAAGDMVVAGLTGVRCHVLNNTWLAAFNFGNAVIILLGAGVDIHGLIDSGRQVCLGSLPGHVGASNFHLQAGLVGRSGYDVKILRVHVYYFTYVLLRY